MKAPTKSGFYWATRITNSSLFDMIVNVVGEAPFLAVHAWRNGNTTWRSTPIEDVGSLRWGPEVEFPAVPPVNDAT